MFAPCAHPRRETGCLTLSRHWHFRPFATQTLIPTSPEAKCHSTTTDTPDFQVTRCLQNVCSSPLAGAWQEGRQTSRNCLGGIIKFVKFLQAPIFCAHLMAKSFHILQDTAHWSPLGQDGQAFLHHSHLWVAIPPAQGPPPQMRVDKLSKLPGAQRPLF